jgi:positive regulator of sigma E activity
MTPRSNRYRGTVLSQQNGKWYIVLTAPEGCAVCHRGFCRDYAGERIVEIPETEQHLSGGQQVWVEVSDQSGWRAIALFYGWPSLLLIAWLLLALTAGVHEGVAGVSALLVLIPYYVVLALTLKKKKDKIHLSVRPV